MAFREYLVSEVTEDYAEGRVARREALRRLGLLGVSLPAASALLAACGVDGETPTDQEAASTPAGPDAARAGPPGASAAEAVRFPGPAGELFGAWAAAEPPRAAVLVIHENRGLTPHFFDVAGRLARDGYAALAPDLLSAQGGTAALSDPGAAPAALSAAPVERLVGDLRAGLDELERRAPGRPLGAIGFCFGGAMVWSLLNAGEARLAAAVPFYGPVPESADFSGAKAAVLGIYAERDARVNATRDRAEAALKAAGLTHELRTFPGVDHAFFNDTGQRYNEAAAREAYTASLDWFARFLSGGAR